MNTEDKNKIVNLFIAVLNNTATESQEVEFNRWLQKEAKNKQLFEDFKTSEFVNTGLNQYASFNAKENWVKFKQLRQKNRARALNRTIKYAVSSAAALAIISIAVYNFPENERTKNRAEVVRIAENISKPTLIIGSKATELTVEVAKIAVNEKLTIENKNSQISYENSTDNEIVENKIVVPKVSKYSVKLDDGTIVMLNANSELIFPNRFTGDSRTVTLKGEAYFNVVKGKSPFIVKMGSTEFIVYGTKFNIKNNINNQIYATLETGSIGIRHKDKDEVILIPGQIAFVDVNSGTIQVGKADLSASLAWINDSFYYERANVRKLLNDLSTWYGIEFNYNAELLKDITITATYDRQLEAEHIIESVGKILNLKFIKTHIDKYDIEVR